MTIKMKWLGVLFNVFMLSASQTVLAQDNWPTKPLKILVPAAPGGTTDMISRIISDPVSKELGQTVIVENKAGAAGIIGTRYLVNSKPDGYTLIMGNIGPNAINYHLYDDLPYKKEDFIPITGILAVPNVLVVSEESPVENVKELVSYVQDNPDKQLFGSSGKGQSPHMSAELFMLRSGLSAEHVPFQGAGPAVAALLGNQFTFMIDNLPSSLPHIQSGKLKALAVTSSERTPFLPDVPTMEEAGIENMVVSAWFGLFAPANTPEAVINKIYLAVNKVLQDEDIKAKLSQLGGVVGGESPDEYASFVGEQQKLWAEIVESANLKQE